MPSVFFVTAGFWRPKIYVSSGALETLWSVFWVLVVGMVVWLFGRAFDGGGGSAPADPDVARIRSTSPAADMWQVSSATKTSAASATT